MVKKGNLVLFIIWSLFFLNTANAAVIFKGVKIQIEQLQVKGSKTTFTHKNKGFEFQGKILNKTQKYLFLSFEELGMFLEHNKIALGGIAGGGGGK